MAKPSAEVVERMRDIIENMPGFLDEFEAAEKRDLTTDQRLKAIMSCQKWIVSMIGELYEALYEVHQAVVGQQDAKKKS